jgi:hypothetical protein
MKTLLSVIIAVTFAITAVAQNGRGTITGTVSDPARAVVPNASVKVTNTQTGAVFETTTTDTGNYTIPQLPLGEYTLSVESPGFTKFVQEGIRVFASDTLRIDVKLQVGAPNESVTVQADASMLKTETAEQSSTLNEEKLDQLPLNFGGLGNSASANIRDPYTFVTLVPSATISSYSTIYMNGIPSNTFRMNLEGQEANNARNISRQDQMEPSVESRREVSVQSSNFSAEFGQVGGGYFNLVVKSGTNNLHGSGFDIGSTKFSAQGNRSRTMETGCSCGRQTAETISAAALADRCIFRMSITAGTGRSSSFLLRTFFRRRPPPR